ncbi:MAG: copper transporter [Jatrophihabitans sp.]|uniref:copper transporter n=1 Tax=Jatrophihabitans sp. TaxID=1932789 RepID=UPI003F7E0413
MISFRYHLVSIIAVFLALALGIVVGTTLLNGPVTNRLRDDVNSLKQQRTDLNNQLKELQTQVDDAGEFASTYGGQLVSGSLANTNVVLLALPGASTDEEDAIARVIAAAGGKVSGRVGLNSQYVDPGSGDRIRQFAVGPARPIGLTLPTSQDAGELAGALLSYVLTGHGQGTDLRSVLGGFAQLQVLSTDGNTVTPSESIVVVGNGGLRPDSYAGAVELALVTALTKYKAHVVVAGDAATAKPGGIVALVRGSATRAGASTVDNADSGAGQVSTVLTLAAADQQQVGHYGTGAGADALFPSPAK